MTAVANLPSLFEEATEIDKQKAYHGNGRESVTHLRTEFKLPDYENSFIANMSLMQFKDKNTGDKLYALHIEIKSPDGLRVPAK